MRGALGMELVRKGPASHELAPTSFRETMYLNARSRRQAQVEVVDPAEYVFPEDEPGIRVEVSGTLRIYNREIFDRDEGPASPSL